MGRLDLFSLAKMGLGGLGVVMELTLKVGVCLFFGGGGGVLRTGCIRSWCVGMAVEKGGSGG